MVTNGSYGWMGKIVRVDLTNRKIQHESTFKYSDRFIGGRGIDVKLLYDEVTPEIDAFDPENRIYFGTGPLTGTPVPGGGRMDVVSRSPLTDILGRSSIGGQCGAELKFCGYDHLVIEGRADNPVYLYIDEDGVQIVDAGELWGKDTYETQSLIRAKHHQQVQVLCIGPAGENQVRFASIQTGIGNAAGRTGMGAVMGSKNLKAIALSGSRGVRIARPDKFLDLLQTIHRTVLEYFTFLAGGTQPKAQDLSGDHFEDCGIHVAGNFESSVGPGIKIQELLKKKGRPYGCTGCPIPCKQVFELTETGMVTGTCIFQGIAGALCTDDLKAWGELVILSQRLGIDQGSLMFILAFIMEMYSKGNIKPEDLDGIPLDKGNMAGAFSLIHKISKREGCGDLFAEGTFKAAKKLNRGIEKYVMHNKGLELLPIELRNRKSTAFAAAISNRGDFQTELWPLADFIIGGGEEENDWLKDFARSHNLKEDHIESFLEPLSYDYRAEIVKHFQPRVAILDTIGWCKWISLQEGVPVFLKDQAAVLSAVTGMDMTEAELLEAGDRICNLERAYNVRAGKTREDDTLPERFFEEPLKAKYGNGEVLNRERFEILKDEYYQLRGWDIKTGIPTGPTLKQLGLNDVADDLQRRKIIED